ncbi:MAG: hypothetical protein Q8L88_07350 [Bacteroidota bacterium]|nr:hypothetical protein [Bacteroidota bacterium]
MVHKSGRKNKLTGQAGEYLVAAELARMDLIATTFTGNVPDYDIIASDGKGRHVSVQVKTSNSESWHFNISSFCKITFDGNRQIIGEPNRAPINRLIVVFVILSHNREKRDRFFLLNWLKLQKIIISRHKYWLDAHNGVRPKNPESLHAALTVLEIKQFEDKWESVLRSLK